MQCQQGSCQNPGITREIEDANPDPDKRRVIGTVTICAEHQAGIDRINDRIRESRHS